jgi:hypothetical protein
METLSDDESLPFQSFSEHDSIHSEQQGSDNEQADTTNPENHEEPDQEPCHEEEEDTDTPRRKKFKTFDFGKKLALKDLTSNAQKRLLDMAMQRMQPPIGGDGTMLEFHGKTYHVGFTIKYLHPVARFLVQDVTTGLPITAPPVKPQKPESNPELSRVYCGLAKDQTMHTQITPVRIIFRWLMTIYFTQDFIVLMQLSPKRCISND